MDHQLFSGVCTALVTPFTNGQVNYGMLEQLLEHQLDAGITTVVLCGTTGESPTLTDQEKVKIFRHCKNYVNDRMRIICGTGSNNTSHAVELSIAAMEAGADALLIVSPYYNKGNLDGQFQHFLSIAQKVKIPIVLYNVPGRTGVDMPVPLYEQLSQVPNIVGVKEASTDIAKVLKIRATCGSQFHIWSGNDDLTVAAMALGAKGVISVLSNVVPKETKCMTDAALCGDFATASALQCKLLPLIDALFKEVNPIPIKAAMKMVGYDCGECRLPLGVASEKTKELLHMILKKESQF
jgi:4-hydroxy-tetrahydrodipicolinate synthase